MRRAQKDGSCPAAPAGRPEPGLTATVPPGMIIALLYGKTGVLSIDPMPLLKR